VFIVNGYLCKIDHSFQSEFHVSPIPNQRLFLGSYPTQENDAHHLNHLGVTGILNVMSDQDIQRYGF
jgi:hypothetical protein